jgi:hypothetical protein
MICKGFDRLAGLSKSARSALNTGLLPDGEWNVAVMEGRNGGLEMKFRRYRRRGSGSRRGNHSKPRYWKMTGERLTLPL